MDSALRTPHPTADPSDSAAADTLGATIVMSSERNRAVLRARKSEGEGELKVINSSPGHLQIYTGREKRKIK